MVVVCWALKQKNTWAVSHSFGHDKVHCIDYDLTPPVGLRLF